MKKLKLVFKIFLSIFCGLWLGCARQGALSAKVSPPLTAQESSLRSICKAQVRGEKNQLALVAREFARVASECDPTEVLASMKEFENESN